MPKTQIVYKVFIKVDGSICSISSANIRNPDNMFPKFSKGRWTKAREEFAKKGYHLTCFEELEDAVRFEQSLFSELEFEVWECEAENVHSPKHGGRAPSYDIWEFKLLLKKHATWGSFSKTWTHMNDFLPWPRKTMMAKRIKPLRVVE